MRIRFSLAKASLFSLMLLIGLGAAVKAAAQLNPNPPVGVAKSAEVTTNDLGTPLVYGVENSGIPVSPAFPSFANLPIIRPLPDPFTYLYSNPGVRDTSFAAWEQHRNEILAAFQRYMVGPKPDCSDCTIVASYTVTSATKYALTVKVTRNVNGNNVTVTLTSAIVVPSGTAPTSGWPFIMQVDGSGIVPSADSAYLASVPYTSSQVTTSDDANSTNDPFYKMYPTLCTFESCTTSYPNTVYNGNSGQMAAFAWGVSRLLDGLQQVTSSSCSVANCPSGPLPVDVAHSGITGCSYAGKIALWSGALDERIALTISQENGGGGVPSWRYSFNVDSEYKLGSHDGSVEDMDTTDHHWWAGSLMHNVFSSVNIYKLPIDLHEVAAMTAPRALVETGNTNSYWLGNESNYVSSRAIQTVYNTLGIGDRFGFIIDGNHGHCSAPASEIASVQQFVDKFLLSKNVSSDVEVYPNQPTDGYGTSQNPKHYYPESFATMDYQRWTSSWGSSNPQFANAWNTGGTVDLWFNNPMTINTGDTVQAGYQVMMSSTTHPAATVKLNNANAQMDVACSDGSSYTLWIPFYTTYGTGQSYAIPAGDNTWYPAAANYQASTTATPLVITNLSTVNPGCANGLPGQVTRTYFNALGAQDNSNGDPAGPGFVTTDTTQSPLWVHFRAFDATTSTGGTWSQSFLVNQLPTN